jgi:methylthioribose-1-phosphate isomerase
MPPAKLRFKTIHYDPDKNVITILDQTRLPGRESYLRLKSAADLHRAIRNLNLRGAPLIGVAAAYGIVLVRKNHGIRPTDRAADYLARARPTAVNLSWSVERMKRKLRSPQNSFFDLYREARAIESEDVSACRRIGTYGNRLIRSGMNILVHCNAGALATTGIGTALGVLYTARAAGKKFTVYAGETRPLLQGARLTTWELTRCGISTYTICDSMAAYFMPEINLILVGADRIAANGDTANKIGTLGLAIIARYNGVPLYVCAPVSSFDPRLRTGADIPIEVRPDCEMKRFNRRRIVAEGAGILNPAFDVTPGRLLSGIITEKLILRPPFEKSISRLIAHSLSPGF